jgi:hypothetical protein
MSRSRCRKVYPQAGREGASTLPEGSFKVHYWHKWDDLLDSSDDRFQDLLVSVQRPK